MPPNVAATAPAQANIASEITKGFTNILIRQSRRMPKAVQVFTYLTVLFVLCYALIRASAGQYSVEGLLVVKRDDRQKAIAGVDVWANGKVYGVNKLGEYHIVLDTWKYARLVSTGKLKLNVIDRATDEHLATDLEIKYDLLEGRLQTFQLEPKPLVVTEVIKGRFGSWWSLYSVIAAEQSPNHRLFVRSIRLTSDAAGVFKGEFDFLYNGKEIDSRLAGNGDKDQEIDEVPMSPGVTVPLSGAVYFPFYLNQSGGALSAEIRIEADRRFKAKWYEHFKLSSLGRLPAPGETFTLKGDHGSEIELEFQPSFAGYSVDFFQADDLRGQYSQIAGDLRRLGFLVRVLDSPTQGRRATNTMWAGPAVPLPAVQTVLSQLRNRKVALKAVQLPVVLKAGDTRRIQVGTSAAAETGSSIPDAVLERMIQAKTLSEFQRELQNRPAVSRTTAARGQAR